MVKSMTGYGRASEILAGREITFEVKSVNHRFFECSVRVPRAYGYLEEKIKAHLKGALSRGKVDVNLSVITVEGKDAKVEVNRALAHNYVAALRELCGPLDLTDDLGLSALSRFGDIFTVTKAEEDENEMWELVRVVADKALAGFDAMRKTEGERLKADLLENAAVIEDYKNQVAARSPGITEDYRRRLYDRMAEVLGTSGIDEQRILTEAAIFAEKTAVDEETVRLSSHLAQFREILEQDGPMGRKLDFLIQEFNREANTIGSKTQDVAAARMVVEIKSAIEKIREQIQNIE